MTETSFTTGAGQPAGPPPPPPPPRAPLRRSLANRKVAGVCGGLGRQLGLDPLLFRVLLAVLVFAGGAGVLIYALAWLLIPEDGAWESEGEKLLHGRGGTGSAAVVVVLLLGFALSGGFLLGRPSSTFAALIIIAVIGALLLARRDPQTIPAASPSGEAADTSTPPQAYQPPSGYQAGPVYGPGSGTAYAPPPPRVFAYGPPPPPEPPRERSFLGLVVLSLGLLTGAVLIAADLAGASVGPRVVLASILLVVGLGMMLGAFFGRALWLLVVAIPLSLALGVVAAVEPTVGAGTGSPVWSPTGSLTENLTYRLGAGDATLDLSGIDISAPTGPSTIRIDAKVGAGRLRIIVPPSVPIQVDLHSGIGQVAMPTEGYQVVEGGFSVDRTFRQLDDRQVRIMIDAETAFGLAEVLDAQA